MDGRRDQPSTRRAAGRPETTMHDTSSTGSDTGSGDRRSISRRTCLKFAGSAAALAAAGSTTVGAEEYDTITVAANSKENIYVYDGETLENLLIDMTADSASAQIITYGSNWTIRDVGFKGIHPGGHYLLTPGVESASGTGLIENVYLGDGQVEGTGSGGVWVNTNLPHRGTITWRNVHIAGMVDNGLYGSGPGTEGYCGNHHVEASYFYNNTISNNRTNALCRRCDVYDTVVDVDGNNPDCGEGCSNPGSNHTRGFWSWYGETYLENVDVRVIDGTTFATAEGGYFTKNNVRTGSDADLTPPDCVPMNAEEAASNTSCDGGGGGGGGGFDEVAEDFSHNDVPGTYSLDTGQFTTTTTRSTSDSYALRPDDAADDGNVIVRDDMGTTAGNTYELDVYHQSSSGADMGFVFGTQSATSWADYTGYLGLFESDADEIRVDRWEDGAQVASAATPTTWPLDEWLTVELDYRDTDFSTITMTVFDASGAEVASVSLGDTTFDSGTIGWYNYHATSDWFADSWFGAGGGGSGTTIDDFEDADLAEYSFDRGSSAASVVTSPVQGGSYALEYVDTNVEAISTSGLNAYPAAGDTFEYWVRGSGGADKTNFTYGVQDHANRYFVRVNVADDNLKVFKWEGNSTPGPLDAQTSGFTLSQDAWYRVKVEWGTGGGHTATLYDASGSQLAKISGSDSTWTSGGVGYDAYLSSGQAAYFDEVRFVDSGGSSTTVLDDFEDGDIAEYSGETSGFQVQGSTVLEGLYTLEGTGTYYDIAHADTTTPRGYEYRCQIEAASGSGAEPSLLASVQDPSSPLQNCYWAFPDASAGAFKLVRRDSGSSTLLDSVSYTLQEAATYEVALELGSSTVKAVLYDSTGSVVAETTAVSDSTHSGGTFGFYTGGGTPGYYDYVTKTPL
jgi:hypothetical protein